MSKEQTACENVVDTTVVYDWRNGGERWARRYKIVSRELKTGTYWNHKWKQLPHDVISFLCRMWLVFAFIYAWKSQFLMWRTHSSQCADSLDCVMQPWGGSKTWTAMWEVKRWNFKRPQVLRQFFVTEMSARRWLWTFIWVTFCWYANITIPFFPNDSWFYADYECRWTTCFKSWKPGHVFQKKDDNETSLVFAQHLALHCT